MTYPKPLEGKFFKYYLTNGIIYKYYFIKKYVDYNRVITDIFCLLENDINFQKNYEEWTENIYGGKKMLYPHREPEEPKQVLFEISREEYENALEELKIKMIDFLHPTREVLIEKYV